MAFGAFLVLYAVIVGVAWLFRTLVEKRDAAAAAADEAAAPARPKRYADKAAPAAKPRDLPSVSAVQARIRKVGSSVAHAEPSLNINDDEAMAQALGYSSAAEYRCSALHDAADTEEDVLGSSSH